MRVAVALVVVALSASMAAAQPVAIYDTIGPDPMLLDGRDYGPAFSLYPIEIHQQWAVSPVVVVPVERSRLTQVQFGHARGIHGNPGPTGCGHWEIHIWTSEGVIAGQPLSTGFFGDFRNERVLSTEVSVSGQVGITYDGLRDIYVVTFDVEGYNIVLEAGEDYALAVVADDGTCQGSGSARNALVTYSAIPGLDGPPNSVYFSGPVVGGTGLVQVRASTDRSASPTNRFAYRIMGEPLVPPCPADINHSGTLTVQDIFDFLAAYFSGDTAIGDFNQTGGISVQDIFDFLAAYFAGCN